MTTRRQADTSAAEEPRADGHAGLNFRDAAVRAPKLSAQVAHRIVELIVSDDVEPGQTLPPERVMVEQLGVSRGTLREALRILEVHGLISLKPGPTGGPVVEEMTGRELGQASTLHFHMAGATFGEIWQARLAIEPMMARLAAERRAPEIAERLGEVMDAAEGFAGEEDFIEATSEFHTTMSGLSGNRVLDLYAIAFSEIWNQHVRGRAFPEAERDRVHDDHHAIADAVIAGDGEAAERLMREHMTEMMRIVGERHPGILAEVVPFAI
jgi:GntR family transcriptional repressor for pyruvate dehydrogenase complex